MAEQLSGSPMDYELDPTEPSRGYDNWPPGEYGTHPRRSTHGWRISIDRVDQDERDRRVLESPVEYFLEACGKYPPLPETEQLDLLQRYADQGDMAARDKLALHSLRFVMHVAKRERRVLDQPPEAMADMLHDGVFGLVKAIENYDYTKGRFLSHAGANIRGAIRREFHNTRRIIRLPNDVAERVLTSRRVFKILYTELGRRPTDNEIADWMYMSSEEYRQFRQNTREAVSLDEFIGKDEDGEWQTRHSLLYTEEDSTLERVAEQQQAAELEAMLERLPSHQREVLKRSFGMGEHWPHTLDEMSRVFNITREAVRQRNVNGLKELTRLAETREFSRRLVRPNQLELSGEEVRDIRMRALKKQSATSFGEYMAFAVRKHTNELGVKLAREERRAREAQMIDRMYESMMQQRSLGRASEAGGRLPSRKSYFASNDIKPPYREPVLGEQYWKPAFRQLYGDHVSLVLDKLYGGLQALTRDDHMVTLTELENHVAAYDDSLYDMRPEFMAAVLEAGEREGIIYCNRSGFITYRLRQPDDPLPMQSERSGTTTIPAVAFYVFEALKALGAGEAQDTAITFSQLRRVWSEKEHDIDENQLRLGMSYLAKSGMIKTSHNGIRGHDIWIAQNHPVQNVRLRSSDLWLEDYDCVTSSVVL